MRCAKSGAKAPLIRLTTLQNTLLRRALRGQLVASRARARPGEAELPVEGPPLVHEKGPAFRLGRDLARAQGESLCGFAFAAERIFRERRRVLSTFLMRASK